MQGPAVGMHLVHAADSLQFGLEWEQALENGNVYNALDACSLLGISAVEMDKQWGICKKADKLVKFGGGFYCGLIEIAGKEPVYAFNGFFMEMRAKYTTPGLSIHYYSVEWDADALSWADFRGRVLGPTDPAEGTRDSARAQIYEKWEELGLAAKPDVGDNGVHASASPFEALAERCNWLGADFETDPYGEELIAAGLDVKTLKRWSIDPQVRSLRCLQCRTEPPSHVPRCLSPARPPVTASLRASRTLAWPYSGRRSVMETLLSVRLFLCR